MDQESRIDEFPEENKPPAESGPCGTEARAGPEVIPLRRMDDFTSWRMLQFLKGRLQNKEEKTTDPRSTKTGEDDTMIHVFSQNQDF